MSNKTFDRITTTLSILLALCFVLSVTAASVNAATFEHGDKYGKGYNDGYSKGYKDGKKDCSKYGKTEILRKISVLFNREKSYNEGFIKGYITSYNKNRYTCLKRTK